LKQCEGDTVSFDYRGVVHHEYTPLGQTVNKEYYQEVLLHLRDAVRHKRPELWDAHNWQLHHTQGFLAKHNILQVHQAPYSPDMAPCDFWLLLRLKTALKGFRFDSCKDIIQNVMVQLHKPSRSASSNGRTAGLSVRSQKTSTLKGIRYCNHPDTELCFPGPRSDTFWTGLVCLRDVETVTLSRQGTC
jgi:hypothetical protein